LAAALHIIPLVLAGSAQSESFTFFLYLAFYIDVLLIWALVFSSGQEPLDVLDPKYAVVLLYTLYSWSAAWKEAFYSRQFESVMPTYCRAVVLGLMGFLLGYQWSHKKGLSRQSSLLSQISVPRFSLLCWVLGVVLAAVSLENLAQFFDPSTVTPYTEWALTLRATRTATSVVFEYTSLLAVYLLITALLLKTITRRATRLFTYLLLALVVVPTVMAGRKDLVLFCVISILIMKNYLAQAVRFRNALLLGVCVYVFATMLNNVRNTKVLSDMWSQSAEYIQSDPAILAPVRSSEISGTPVTFMEIAQAIQEGRLSYSFGQTYLTEAVTFVPRILYPERPRPLAEEFMAIFYPRQAAMGAGHALFILGDGYWAFGYIGVFAEMFIYGSIISWIYGLLLSKRNSPPIVAIYANLYFPLVIGAMRGTLLGTMKATLMGFAPFAVLLLFSRESFRAAAAEKVQSVSGSANPLDALAERRLSTEC
jgi:hypothetical protein